MVSHTSNFKNYLSNTASVLTHRTMAINGTMSCPITRPILFMCKMNGLTTPADVRRISLRFVKHTGSFSCRVLDEKLDTSLVFTGKIWQNWSLCWLPDFRTTVTDERHQSSYLTLQQRICVLPHKLIYSFNETLRWPTKVCLHLWIGPCWFPKTRAYFPNMKSLRETLVF